MSYRCPLSEELAASTVSNAMQAPGSGGMRQRGSYCVGKRISSLQNLEHLDIQVGHSVGTIGKLHALTWLHVESEGLGPLYELHLETPKMQCLSLEACGDHNCPVRTKHPSTLHLCMQPSSGFSARDFRVWGLGFRAPDIAAREVLLSLLVCGCLAPRVTVVCQRPCHCFHALSCPLCLVCAAGYLVATPTMADCYLTSNQR